MVTTAIGMVPVRCGWDFRPRRAGCPACGPDRSRAAPGARRGACSGHRGRPSVGVLRWWCAPAPPDPWPDAAARARATTRRCAPGPGGTLQRAGRGRPTPAHGVASPHAPRGTRAPEPATSRDGAGGDTDARPGGPSPTRLARGGRARRCGAGSTWTPSTRSDRWTAGVPWAPADVPSRVPARTRSPRATATSSSGPTVTSTRSWGATVTHRCPATVPAKVTRPATAERTVVPGRAARSRPR